MNCVGSTAGPDFTNTSKNTYLYNVCVLQGVKYLKTMLTRRESDTVTWTFETDSLWPRMRNIGHGYS